MAYEDKVQQISGPPQCHGSKKGSAERRDLPETNTPPPTNTSFAHTARGSVDLGWPLQPPEDPQITHLNNRKTIIQLSDRHHRYYLPQMPLSNSPASLSISHSTHCTLSRPSGNSKTDSIPVLCRSNKLVSEYLPDTPTLLIQSQHYVAASNSRAKS